MFPLKLDIIRGRKHQGRLRMNGKYDETFSRGRSCKSTGDAGEPQEIGTSLKSMSYKYLNVSRIRVLRLGGWHVKEAEHLPAYPKAIRQALTAKLV